MRRALDSTGGHDPRRFPGRGITARPDRVGAGRVCRPSSGPACERAGAAGRQLQTNNADWREEQLCALYPQKIRRGCSLCRTIQIIGLLPAYGNLRSYVASATGVLGGCTLRFRLAGRVLRSCPAGEDDVAAFPDAGTGAADDTRAPALTQAAA